MATAYTGGCACGRLRYRIDDEPLAMNDCQCRQCQQRSGTGHGSYLTFPSRDAVHLEGRASEWDVTGDAGTLKRHAFCGACGAPVYLTFPAMPALFTIHAGSLDDPTRYRPQCSTYASSAQPWDAVAPTLQRFERMPPSPGRPVLPPGL